MTSRFQFSTTSIPGLIVIDRLLNSDSRGTFERVFCIDELQAGRIGFRIAQVNRSITLRRGTVRGLHFQYPPHAEVKLVTCTRGRIFDVAVDLRKDSSTFLKWFAVELSDENHRSLLIPAGFAHGLQALSDNCEVLYLHDEVYTESAEARIMPLDPSIAISWPIEITEMSDRDRNEPLLPGSFGGVSIEV